MCKKFNFHHTTKWYMHKPEPVLENETHKILWDFEVHSDHLIPARRLDLVLIDKKEENLSPCGFYRPGRPPSENERKRKDAQILGNSGT